MDEVDIGLPSEAVFTRLEHDVTGRPRAAFVSRYGDVFCLTVDEVRLRIRYLEMKELDAVEEHRALRRLRAAGG